MTKASCVCRGSLGTILESVVGVSCLGIPALVTSEVICLLSRRQKT